MFSSTGNVLCLACRSPMQLIAIMPVDYGKHTIEFGCTKCNRVRMLEMGHVECQHAEGIAA